MIVSTYSRRPQSSYSGSTPGFTRIYYGTGIPPLLARRASISINHFMSLVSGDKLRMVAISVNGNLVETVASTVRFRIRKKL